MKNIHKIFLILARVNLSLASIRNIYTTSNTTNNSTTIDYIYGTEGIVGLILKQANSQVRQQTNPQTNQEKTYYYIKNLQGDVTHIVDESGNIQASYKYDAWGNHKVCDANGKELSNSQTFTISGFDSHIGNINPIRYRGYYWDSETSLYYLQSRYYDPQVGRFINADAIDVCIATQSDQINGLNLYAYCMNNPVMCSDSTGMSSFWDSIGKWFKDHWVELTIGAAFIVAGVLTMGVAAAIGGATFGGIMATMGSAALSSAIQVGISMGISGVIGGTMSAISGDGFMSGFGNELASGFMLGGIFAGVARMASGAMSITRSLAQNFNGKILGRVKLWSPNSSTNPNIGGTLIKFGKYNRFDVEVGRGLHMAWKIFGHKVNHIPLGVFLGGGIGGFSW